MCDSVKEYARDCIDEKERKSAENMRNLGLSDEIISKSLDRPEEVIRQWLDAPKS